jgi:hypothetical protein
MRSLETIHGYITDFDLSLSTAGTAFARFAAVDHSAFWQYWERSLKEKLPMKYGRQQ